MEDQIHPTLRQELPQESPEPQEQAQQPEQQVQPAPEQPRETQEMKHFRNLRDKTERLERERDEALRKIKEYESQRAPQAQDNEPDDDFAINDGDLVEGKHFSKLKKQIKALNQKLETNSRYSTEIAIEARLKSQYPDFDKVVSQENIRQLSEDEPELAQTLMSSQDLYSKGAAAYKLIKKLGIGAADPYAEEKQIAHANATKPRPMASLSPQQGDSPLSHANAFSKGLTDELKKKLHQEMLDAMKYR